MNDRINLLASHTGPDCQRSKVKDLAAHSAHNAHFLDLLFRELRCSSTGNHTTPKQ
jgi:hypothetical protein